MSEAFDRHPPGTPSSAWLAPSIAEILTLGAITFLYLLAMAANDQNLYPLVNVGGPIAVGTTLSYNAWRAIRRNRNNLWTALLWFRISTVAYFCFGTFVVFLLDPLGRSYVEAFFQFYDEDILKLNLIVSLSLFLALIAAWCVIALGGPWWLDRRGFDARPERNEPRQLMIAGAVFLVVGILVDLTLKAPHGFGWSAFEVPGSIMNLSRLGIVGIFLVTFWSLQHARWALPMIIVIVVAILGLQLLLFSKQGMLLPLGMFFLAFIWHRTTIRRMAGAAAIVCVVFAALHPVVSEARNELERRYGEYPTAGFTERADIIGDALASVRWFDASNEGASGLTRLSQVGAATLVINQYDVGRPGDWPRLLPAVFVPRLFWPGKPIITDVAKDIYELGTGLRTSQAGAGIFADTYWAMGWTGVLLFMPIYGGIIGCLSVLSARIVRDGRWLFFPIALMGVQIGYRTDGHYLADVAGGTVILVGSYVMLRGIELVVTHGRASVAIRRRSAFPRASIR